MEIKISKVNNGYIVSGPSDYDGTEVIHVYEEDYENPCSCAEILGVISCLLEIFGELKSKHSEHRVEFLCKCQKETKTI